MRANAYRISLLILVLGSMVLSSYCMYIFCSTNPEYAPKLLTILATIFLLFIQIFEIISLIKGFKKERFIIHDLIYEGSEINKFPLIIDNILLAIGLALTITFTVFIYTIPKYIILWHFFIEVGVYLSINCIYYDLYILVYKLDQKDQLKLIGR